MENEYTQIRKQKLKNLKDLGINPYPYSFNKKYSSIEALKLKVGTKKVTLAGRLMLIRDMGRLCFAHVQDEAGKIQIAFNEKDLGKDKYKFFIKNFDLGDFIGVEGEMFKTHKGEVTLLVKKFEMLSKSLRPLPDKWHGLIDTEERYRKRYLDLIMNPEVKEVFVKRTKIINAIREFLNGKGFLEVETPALQTLYGGTNARPFSTHLNALDMDLYLRVAPELYLKRLIVGGFEKIYEIGRNFRNEGIDHMHNPEFTMIEWYEAYADYNKMMDNAEDLYKFIAKKVNGDYIVNFKNRKIDLKGKWPRVSMAEIIKKKLKIDVDKMSLKELESFAKKNKIESRGEAVKGILVNSIFEKMITEKLDGPIWIIDYPREVSPLAKPHRSKEGYVERFECYIAGSEIGDGWSEIINPLDQKERFEKEQKAMRVGDKEAHPMDKDFIEALEHGMPVLGGIGIGIDRLVMFFTDSSSIRDVILFPFMRPEKE